MKRAIAGTFLACGLIWFVLCLALERTTGLLGATNLATPAAAASISATPPSSPFQLQAPTADMWHMYNAI
jgi:hypothetical protein